VRFSVHPKGPATTLAILISTSLAMEFMHHKDPRVAPCYHPYEGSPHLHCKLKGKKERFNINSFYLYKIKCMTKVQILEHFKEYKDGISELLYNFTMIS
jgi:hypothetical protein